MKTSPERIEEVKNLIAASGTASARDLCAAFAMKPVAAGRLLQEMERRGELEQAGTTSYLRSNGATRQIPTFRIKVAAPACLCAYPDWLERPETEYRNLEDSGYGRR